MQRTKFYSGWGVTMFMVGIVLGVPLGATLWPAEKVIVREGTADTPAALTSVNLMIDYGNGTVKTWNTVTHHESMSVIDLLEFVAGTGNIQLGTKGEGEPSVDSIDGVTNDDAQGLRWQYWINNTYEPRVAAKYFLKPGDIVLWKYVKEQAQS